MLSNDNILFTLFQYFSEAGYDDINPCTTLLINSLNSIQIFMLNLLIPIVYAIIISYRFGMSIYIYKENPSKNELLNMLNNVLFLLMQGSTRLPSFNCFILL